MTSIPTEAASSRGGTRGVAIEDHPDPYEIAYLRGGITELLKLHLFDLVQKGRLVVATESRWHGTKRWLVAAADTPDQNALSQLEQNLLALYNVRRSPDAVL